MISANAREVDGVGSQSLVQLLSLAVEQSPASVIITDASGIILYVNPHFTEVSGYDADEVIGRGPRILRSSQTPHEIYRDLWRTITSGHTWHGELSHRRKNDETWWGSLRVSPVRNTNGQVSHFVAFQNDISTRKQAEAVRQEREERFSQIAGTIKDVFFMVDSSLTETLYINQAYEQVWGRTRQSLHENPLSFLEAILPEDRHLILAQTRIAQAGGEPVEIEFRIVRPDGGIRSILARAAPIRNSQGEVYRISAVATDITERRLAEEALRVNEERFRELVENCAEMMFISDPNSGFALYLSPAYEKIWGRSVASGCATPRAWLDGVHPEDLARMTAVTPRVGDGESNWDEFRVIRPDGSTRWVRSRSSPVLGADGQVLRMVGVAEDLTELHLAEQHARQSQKMDAVGQLAGGVAHDFNNLLTVISAYTSMLMDGLAPEDPRCKDLQEIERAATAAAGLTRQLLAFTRQQVIEPKLIAFDDAVLASSRMLGRLIGDDIEVITLPAADLAAVWIDPSQFEQIILNLSVNARDAMRGGGRLTIETQVVHLDASYVRTHGLTAGGDFAMVAISDTGAGMSAETQARIFEPFFTTKPVGQGTGLGLATVYGIVNQCSGFVWVYSELGHGTTFKVYLPLAEEPPEIAHRTEQAVTIPRGKETVLLVEDSAAVRLVAKQMLERAGYTVLEASTGKAALRYATGHDGTIDLMLTDVVMPELNGHQLARQFRAARPSTKVLYMSGHANDAFDDDDVSASGIAFLQKPFSPEALANKVREMLDRA